jgi:hypothetical protein
MRSLAPPAPLRRDSSEGGKNKSEAVVAPTAAVDLESPYGVEASEAVLRALTRLVKGIAGGTLLASMTHGPSVALTAGGKDTGDVSRLLAIPAVLALLQIARATLRRGVASGVSLVVSGCAAAPDTSSSSTSSKEKLKPSTALLELTSEVQSLVTWGGSASGVPLSQIPSSSDDLSAIKATAAAAAAGKPIGSLRGAPSVQDAAWLLLEQLPFGGTTSLLLRKACAGAGVLELELTWPWSAAELQQPAVGGSNAATAAALPPLPIHMEALALSLQLHAAQNGWRYLLRGCWPSRLSVVIDIPASPGVSSFLAGDFLTLNDEAGASCGTSGSIEFPTVLERSASFERLTRIDTSPGFGALHVYPGFAASFDEVTAAVSAFFPEERLD